MATPLDGPTDPQTVAHATPRCGSGWAAGSSASRQPMHAVRRTAVTAALTLADVLDLRAYERVREDYRARVIARKRLRRVALGPIMTLVFESVDTVRFQIQEMARVEKILTDEAIQTELDIYNRLLPQVGELSATLFIELTTDGSHAGMAAQAGRDRDVLSGVALGDDVVQSVPEEAHAAALVRETITPAVHYIRFSFTPAQVEAFADLEEVSLVARHPEYEERTVLPDPMRQELLGDLRGTTKPLPIG